jgi:hypothetical protein
MALLALRELLEQLELQVLLVSRVLREEQALLASQERQELLAQTPLTFSPVLKSLLPRDELIYQRE